MAAGLPVQRPFDLGLEAFYSGSADAGRPSYRPAPFNPKAYACKSCREWPYLPPQGVLMPCQNYEETAWNHKTLRYVSDITRSQVRGKIAVRENLPILPEGFRERLRERRLALDFRFAPDEQTWSTEQALEARGDILSKAFQIRDRERLSKAGCEPEARDCALGFGLPVMGLVLTRKSDGKHAFHIGADPLGGHRGEQQRRVALVSF